MTRTALEQWVRSRWDEVVRLAGTQAADDAREQAALPEVFVWSLLTVADLRRLGVALRIRSMEVLP